MNAPALTATFVIITDAPGSVYVVRLLSGDDVKPSEARNWTFGPYGDHAEATTFAAKAALRFAERYPGTVTIVEPEATPEQHSLVRISKEARGGAGREAA